MLTQVLLSPFALKFWIKVKLSGAAASPCSLNRPFSAEVIWNFHCNVTDQQPPPFFRRRFFADYNRTRLNGYVFLHVSVTALCNTFLYLFQRISSHTLNFFYLRLCLFSQVCHLSALRSPDQWELPSHFLDFPLAFSPFFLPATPLSHRETVRWHTRFSAAHGERAAPASSA